MMPIDEKHPLVKGGIPTEDVPMWDQRYKDSNLDVTYDEWCKGVVALNTEQASEGSAKMINRAITTAISAGGIEAMVDKHTKKPVIVLGSYKKTKK